jgi:phenol 2-monooxygenase (NADPH)
MVPSEKTDFPDTRNKSAIHSANGSCMVIPREGDKIRVYIQLSDTDAVDPETGRVNLGRYGPERLLEVAKKAFRPYTIDTVPDKIEWWTIYQSKNPHFRSSNPRGRFLTLHCLVGQRVASSFTAKERVFIAGDACHTHSPQAGQGMNASMNDTHNLGSHRGFSSCYNIITLIALPAWKLAHVLRGWADISLLKTVGLDIMLRICLPSP